MFHEYVLMRARFVFSATQFCVSYECLHFFVVLYCVKQSTRLCMLLFLRVHLHCIEYRIYIMSGDYKNAVRNVTRSFSVDLAILHHVQYERFAD